MSPPALRIVAGAAFTIGLLLGPALPSQSQTTTSTASKTRTHVQTLASDKLEGRMAGSEGEKLAADYIAGELTRIDAKPLPGMTSVFPASPWPPGCRPVTMLAAFTRVTVGKTAWWRANVTPARASRWIVGVRCGSIWDGWSPSKPTIRTRRRGSRPGVRRASRELAARMIFVTGDSLSPDVAQFLGGTDAPVLEKPVDPAELIARVRAGLQQPRA